MAQKKKYTWEKKTSHKEEAITKTTENNYDDIGLGYILVVLGIVSVVISLFLRDTRTYLFSLLCFMVGWWKLKTISNKY